MIGITHWGFLDCVKARPHMSTNFLSVIMGILALKNLS